MKNVAGKFKAVKDGLVSLWGKIPPTMQTTIICTVLTAAGVPTEACRAVASVI